MASANLVRAAKKELRQAIKQRLSTVSADSINAQTRNVLDILFTMPEYLAARRISIYLSMPSGEIDTSSIVNNALQQKKKVFVPYTHKVSEPQEGLPKSIMDMVSLHSREDYESLKADNWGIPTPSRDSIAERENCLENTSQDQSSRDLDSGLDMVVMPGMAFDRGLRRLGHGRGFYDFFLHRYRESSFSKEEAAHRMPILVGIALEEQVLPGATAVPVDSTDWPLDAMIVGDGRLLRGARRDIATEHPRDDM